MRLKLFKSSGVFGVKSIEKEVNEWLISTKPQINKVETNMCSAADTPTETHQYIVVSVWYEG